MGRTSFLFAAFTLALAGTAMAQDVFTKGVQISDTTATDADLYVEDKTVLDGNLCVGSDCTLSEVYTDELVRLKHGNVSILFVDSSVAGGTFPTNDWRLRINENTQNGLDLFGIEDVTGGTMPFVVEAGAPDSAVWVDHFGSLGLGTSMPQQELHIARAAFPGMILEQTGQPGWLHRSWQMSVLNPGRFAIYEIEEGSPTFIMESSNATNAADQQLKLWRTGNTGVTSQGHPGADARFYVGFDDGSTQVKIEETSAVSNPRTLLNLQNNGRPEIVMGNTATNGEWSFGAGTDFFLKVGTVGSTSGAKDKVFTVKQTGDVIVQGTLTTGGTTCGGGCDRVFEAGYDLPSIADHAEKMFELGHLPNVGPTVEGAPFDMTDKVGRMLNELEHAHIYIAELEGEVGRLRQALEVQDNATQAALAGIRTELEALKRD